MMKLRYLTFLLLTLLTIPAYGEEPSAQQTAVLYQNGLTDLSLGKLPKEFMILDGKFSIVDLAGNKVIELPGNPLEDFAFLFGPSEKIGVCIGAKIKSESTRRTFPSFGIGSSGVSGYKFFLEPAKKIVELHRGTEVKAQAPFEWKSDTWIQFRLQVTPVPEGKWNVQAKAWYDGTPEPQEWLKYLDEKEPPNGRPSVWGTPFSGKPIYFDDLRVVRVEGQ
jgi:hypothetical protein